MIINNNYLSKTFKVNTYKTFHCCETWSLTLREEQSVPYSIIKCLDHGCARVAHCVTAKSLNISHYCRPLRQYDV